LIWRLNDPGVWIVSGTDGASMTCEIVNGYGERLLFAGGPRGRPKEFQRRNLSYQYSRLDDVRQRSLERFGRIPPAR
jgi:hypothetical protein